MTTIELYDMGATQPLTTEVEEGRTLAEAVELKAGDVLVLVDDERDEIDGDIDFVELDLRCTVQEAAKGRSRLTILRNPRAKVTVHVHYAGVSKPLHVHAATRIRRIRKLAIAALGIDPESAADTSLRLEGSDIDLPPKTPVGAYLNKGEHQIDLDLVHKVRPQG